MNTKTLIHENTFSRWTVKTLLFALLLVLGVGQAAGQEPVEDGGYYLIQNENNEKMYYLLPSSHQYWQGNAATPYLRTAMTARETSVFRIERDNHDDKTCYRFVHAVTGKYIVYNTAIDIDPNKNDGAIIHLETIADVSSYATPDYLRFRFIKSTNNNYGIVHYGLGEKTSDATSWNAFGTNDHTTRGRIGLWRSDNDASSRWIFVKTTAPVTVAYNSGASTFTASCTDGDATIYYTTDGSDPTTSDTRAVYSGPVSATGVGLFRATAEKAGCKSVVYDAVNTDVQFLMEHMQSPGFYLLPHSDGSKLNVNSLARPTASWTLEDAGTFEGAQYYYLHLADASVDKYLHYAGGNGGALTLKATNDNSNNYKFRFDYDFNSGTYHIVPMVNPSNMLRKQTDNEGTKTLYTMSETDVNKMHNARKSTDVQWNLVPKTMLPMAPPFDVSDNTTTHAYRIKNTSATAYYMMPPRGPVGNIQYASTINNSESYTVWLFKDAGSDEWLRYYYIVNAITGEYLYYREAVSDGDKNNAFTTKRHTGSETGEEENRFRFAVANTATPANSYYITPYLMRYENDGINYRLIRRDGTNALKLSTERRSDDRKWYIEDATVVAPPVVTVRASDNKVVFSCQTPGVTYYYTTDGKTAPTTSSTLYSEPFDATSGTTYKVIAVKDGVSSFVTTYQVSVLTGNDKLFIINNNEISHFYMTSLGNIETEGARVTTTNIPGQDLFWYFMDGGVIDGVQYYYIVSKTDDAHMALDNNKIVTKPNATFEAATGDDLNIYRFKIVRSVSDTGADATGFMILPMNKSALGLRKADHNHTNPIVLTNTGNTNELYNNQSRWRFYSRTNDWLNWFTKLDDSFVTSSTCPKYLLIQNKGNSSPFLTPNAATASPATTASDGEHQEWYISQASNERDGYKYYIRNAATGEYLCWIGTAGQENANSFTTVVSPTNDCKFLIPKTADTSDGTSYNIVPIALMKQRNQNKISLNTDGTTLYTKDSRNNTGSQWVIMPTYFQFAPPVITKDDDTNTITITAEAGATIRYVGYNTSGSEPTLTPTAGGSVYTGPFTSDYTYYKAIAYRCTDDTDVSEPNIFGRTATPVINYDFTTGTVTITCATAGATIYYTTNGSEPTSGSTRYDAPFQQSLDNPVVIKAVAILGDEISDVAVFNQMPIPVSSTDEMTDMAAYYLIEDGFVGNATIGTAESPFKGTIDGNFNAIMLNQPLVGYANGAIIKNVRVGKATVSGSGNIGALVNEASGATLIYNCGVMDATSTVTSSNAAAGGLVGHIASGASVKVVNCYNYATVSGSTHSAGIVGNNESNNTSGTRIAMCVMYGDMTTGTNRSPVYYGGHTSNSQNYTEYNYYRSRANLTYTAYNDQLAIGKDEWLTRFPFYRHILNTHRELAAFFLFGNTVRPQAPKASEVAEIGHWVLDTDVAPYPIIEPWATDTKKTTVDINANLPSTANRYEGKKLDDITADKVYRGDGTQVTTMGTSGMLRVNYSINGTSGYIDLPITDMDTLRYDYTWGKVVLPFANEFEGWTRDYSRICTGWKITGISGGTAGSLTNYNFADRDCTAKDLYSNSNYIFAQGGNFIVPYGVTAITIEANFANAFYLSDARADFGYDANYGNQTNLGWAVPATYHGQTVYTNLSTLVYALSESTDPHSQAIVLVGNYHYNQNTIGGVVLDKSKACTIMSIDDDNNQEPDYGWYSFCNANSGRSGMPHIRFDLLPNIGIGMAARVTNSTPNPTIGIMQCSGSFELTETCVSYMSECEVEGNGGSKLSAADNGHGNNRYIINSGYFIQIVRTQKVDVSNLSYMKIGGNAFIEQLYPGSHSDQAQSVNLVPIIVNGGEIEECYMTGYRAGASAIGSDIRFWCAGGKIHKFLGAYMEKPRQTSDSDGTVNLTAKVDHALIKRFFGGGTSASATITGNINITMNNSKVNFFCGGPEFGDMSLGKTVTTTAYGSTFGEYYGAGFGGTATTRVRGENASSNTDGQQEVTFSAATTTYPLAFSNYHYLTNKSGYGVGVGYEFEFIQYAGGTDGKGVARFYTDYASFSLATTGSVTNRLTNCNILKDFYGAGCQGKVNGTVTSTLTGCTVNGSVFGGGYKAESNELKVMPNTEPTYSVYTKETGLFSDFGTVNAETWEWKQGTAAERVVDKEHKTIYCSNTVKMSELGNVTGVISLTIDGCTVTTRTENGVAAGGNVFGGGNESKSLSNTTVTISDTAGETNVANSVYGGGNKADVMGNATVTIGAGNVLGNVYGGGNEGSVGTFTADANGKPATCGENTGKCTVVIEGNAEIGPDGMQMTRAERPDDYGHVFGAGKGLMADPADYPEIANIAYVDNTDVTVRGNAFVKGSVYGGSESGHVLHNTDVKIEGGQIGCGKETTEPFGDDVWSDTYVPTDNNNLDCPSWTFEKPYAPYDPYANATGNLDQYENGKSTDGGRRVASDGHTYYGNVFGGGSGSIPYFDETKGTSEYLMTAGMVEGNTSVTISGGHVLTNVYGGCETTNVLGSVTIAMTGGTVGVPRTVAQIVAHPLTGYIFGAGKGDQRVFFNKDTNVDRVTVSVEGGRVYSSVYGGGEDGHVLQNTTVNIGKAGEAGPTIGTWGTSYVDGNVFGGGRGFGGEALTAGNVGGSVELNIISGKILGSVYGGGRMASVGYGLYLVDEEITEDEKKIKPYGILRPDDKYDGSYPNPSTEDAADYYDKGRGYITINITGGTIGNNSEYIYNPTAEQKAAIPKTTFDYQNHLQYTKGGNVFTGGMGRLYALDNTTLLPLWSKLGKCKQTTLNMTGGTVKSSIYGGGELGAVAENATVNINGGTVGTKVVDKEDETKYYYFGSVFGGGKGSVDNITYPSATPEEEQIPISEAGTTGGKAKVNLNKGIADDQKGAVVHQVFGCNDMNGSPKDSVIVHIYATQTADSTDISTKPKKGTETFDVEAVYGGGNLAAYEPEGGKNTTKYTKVIIDGCGLTSIRQVYGGGNAASTPATNVEVNGTYEVLELFGGGNGLDKLPDGRPNPGANVGYKNYTVYEQVAEEWIAKDDPAYDTKEERTAGNSAITYGTGQASINVFGGTVHRVFGGSNTKGNVRKTAVTLLDEGGECEFCVDEAYGGGKSAPMDAEAKLLMACIPGLNTVYGGAEAAAIQGNVTLNITNGTFDRVFGGNNLSGTINGSITVNIEEIGCRPIKIGELYGGGNQAGYSVYGYNTDGTPKESGTKIYEDPQINVKSFTSIGKVFGGGYGDGATMVGNPTVNVNEVYGRWYNDDTSVVGEDAKTREDGYSIPSHAKGKMGAISEIFGGGNAAKVIGSTTVNIATQEEVYLVKQVTAGTTLPAGCYTRSGAGTTTSPFVYTEATGTASADITYYEKKNVEGADIRGNVYGGGNNAEVTGNTNVTIGKPEP